MPTGKHRKTTCVHHVFILLLPGLPRPLSPKVHISNFERRPCDFCHFHLGLKIIKPRMPVYIIPLADLVFCRDNMEQSTLLLEVCSCLNALFVSSQLHLPPSLHLCFLAKKIRNQQEINKKSTRNQQEINKKSIRMYVRSLWSLWNL